MKPCETCGNVYEDSFEIEMGASRYTFDSFECAIQRLAPVCSACNCRIIGHGVKGDGGLFCCAHCARKHDVGGVVDNADK